MENDLGDWALSIGRIAPAQKEPNIYFGSSLDLGESNLSTTNLNLVACARPPGLSPTGEVNRGKKTATRDSFIRLGADKKGHKK